MMDHTNSYLSTPTSNVLTPLLASTNGQGHGLYAYETSGDNCLTRDSKKMDINQLLQQLMSITDQSLKEAEKRLAAGLLSFSNGPIDHCGNFFFFKEGRARASSIQAGVVPGLVRNKGKNL
jgi:hypothetical protein